MPSIDTSVENWSILQTLKALFFIFALTNLSGFPALHSAAKNTQTGEDVAIKKVTKVFEKAILAKRALREVKLLRHFSGHENVCAL